ncbi:hypothetical protein V5H35_17130 [Vibrio cholerae]|uniref:hypothetical protein n=1 Tax=Vibrio cholerae TaxID=666 RepID=UPI003967C59A
MVCVASPLGGRYVLGGKLIKQPPYKVEFGQLGEVPPMHVISIDNTSIRLSGNSQDILDSGYTDAVMACNGIESEETKKAMLELNRQGFVFAYDYKAYISPSYYMKQLLLSGDLTTSFKEISWRNPKQWCLTEYEFELRT